MNSAERSNKLELTTPSDREIVMTRSFAAPRTTVFDAFTKPELVRRWLLGPCGWSMPVCDIDLKPGGKYKYTWRNDADGKEFGVSGTFLEVARPERTVHLEKFDEEWYPGEAQITTTFIERNGATLTTMTILHESREARDQALETGMADGVAVSYDRLEDILDSAA
jgi:uncharacterized protein YndB with AHSA1/START domain